MAAAKKKAKKKVVAKKATKRATPKIEKDVTVNAENATINVQQQNQQTAQAAKPAAVDVSVKVSGGRLMTVAAATLGELKAKMEAKNYQATIDGEPKNDDNHALTEGQFVTLTAPVKGA